MRAFSCRGIPSSLEQFIVSSAVVGFQDLVLAAGKTRRGQSSWEMVPWGTKEKK